MGVFVDDAAEDTELIRSVLEAFAKYWNEQEFANQLKIEEVTEVAAKFSSYADEVFQNFFERPSHYQRIAAFLALVTACPCLSLRAEGKLVSNKENRQWFFARVNFMLLPGLFELLNKNADNAPKWPGFPSRNVTQQLVAWFELIDISDLIEPGTNSHSIKGLAKDIAALALILQQLVESKDSVGHDDLLTFFNDTGLLKN